jgi:hypothetical protein
MSSEANIQLLEYDSTTGNLRDDADSSTKSLKTAKTKARTNVVPSTTRRHRTLQRTLWGSVCLLFTVFYPVGMTVLLVFKSPSGFNGNPCGTETMTSASLLAPDTLFGSYTVTSVRAIDLTWNLLMGRGLPFLMALVFFRVATVALTRIAENQGVSYELFATITLNLHTWYSIIPLFKGILKIAGWKHKAGLAFMFYAALLVLLMPTFMDLQTGYVRSQVAGWRFENGTIVEADGRSCDTGDRGTEFTAARCSFDGVIASSVCVDGEGYQWGFSFAWFSITHFLTGFWAAGLYVHISKVSSNHHYADRYAQVHYMALYQPQEHTPPQRSTCRSMACYPGSQQGY